MKDLSSFRAKCESKTETHPKKVWLAHKMNQMHDGQILNVNFWTNNHTFTLPETIIEVEHRPLESPARQFSSTISTRGSWSVSMIVGRVKEQFHRCPLALRTANCCGVSES